jgi:hypothetical protein
MGIFQCGALSLPALLGPHEVFGQGNRRPAAPRFPLIGTTGGSRMKGGLALYVRAWSRAGGRDVAEEVHDGPVQRDRAATVRSAPTYGPRTTGADRHRHSGLAQRDAQLALLTRQVSRADSPLEGPFKLHAALRHLPERMPP